MKYNRFQLACKYLHYYFTASNGKGHGIHSPFVFEFITKVLNDTTVYPAYEKVEDLRKKLLKDTRWLTAEDLGAGGRFRKNYQRSISSIAKNAAKPKKYARLLFRLVQYYKPGTILELGTSLGLTSAYLSMANPAARLVTMEGAGEIAGVAKHNFEKLGIKNAELIEGNFDDTLASAIGRPATVDFAFIDGNHRQEPTLRYFSQLLPKIKNDSILVFDDIHWSPEMESSWEIIQNTPEVKCTVDLFFLGIVFFRKEFYKKQHFRIRF